MSRFYFNDTANTEIYTLSLHDALPICLRGAPRRRVHAREGRRRDPDARGGDRPRQEVQAHDRGRGRPADHEARLENEDRKSTRLNSSHVEISYAVYCLTKKRR